MMGDDDVLETKKELGRRPISPARWYGSTAQLVVVMAAAFCGALVGAQNAIRNGSIHQMPNKAIRHANP